MNKPGNHNHIGLTYQDRLHSAFIPSQTERVLPIQNLLHFIIGDHKASNMESGRTFRAEVGINLRLYIIETLSCQSQYLGKTLVPLSVDSKSE